MKGTEFMRQVRVHDINYRISEPGMHNQNPDEGVIREIRRKRFIIITTFQKRMTLPQRCWRIPT